MATQTKPMIIDCPKCQCNLRIFKWKTVEVDICDSCYGIWLDQGEILVISKLDTLENIDNTFEGEYQEATDTERKAQLKEAERPCPVDGSELSRHVWTGGKEIVVDSCLKCYGIWFDAGELEGYVEELIEMDENPFDVPDEVWLEIRQFRKDHVQDIYEAKKRVKDRIDEEFSFPGSHYLEAVTDLIFEVNWANEKKSKYDGFISEYDHKLDEPSKLEEQE